MNQSENSRSISLRYKIIAYVVIWMLALFATDPSASFWALAYMFPLGLAAVINVHLGNDGGWGVFGPCIAIYLVHAYFFFRSKTSRSTMLWFGLLVLLLLGNVSGCRSMIHGH